MPSSELLNKIRLLVEDVKSNIDEIEAVTRSAHDSWPDYAFVKNFGEWRDRTETPPAGPVWASDGFRVWIIHRDGKPIDRGATSIKFWTAALIPAPPIGPIVEHSGGAQCPENAPYNSQHDLQTTGKTPTSILRISENR